MYKKVRLTLSPVQRTEKPKDAAERARENSLISSKNTVEITLEDFATAILNGQSFSHGVFSGQRESKNFVSSDLVVLDVDNKDSEQILTLGDALKRLKENGLDCNMAYTSFSDAIPKGEFDPEVLKTAKRYRLIFVLPQTVWSLADLDHLLQNDFYTLFPEADPMSGAQMWYAGYNIGYSNYDYVLDLEVLHSVVALEKTGNMKSGKRRNEKLKSLAVSPDYVLKMGGQNVRHSPHSFNIIKGLGGNGTKHPIRNFNWEWACSEFDLLDSFLNYTRKIYYKELFYLYLAMSKIEGGAKKWKESVINNPLIDNQKMADVAYYLERRVRVLDYQIFEAKISNYAPDDKAAFKYDFLTNISNKLSGKIEIVNEDENYLMPEPNATSALNYYFKEAKADFGNGKYVFKCATGLGKTEEIIRCNNLAECVIAVPTHKLKDEISARLKKQGVEHYVIPELPKLPDPIKHQYETLSKIGAFEEAASLLWQVASGENVSKFGVGEDELLCLKEALGQYFREIEACQDTTFPVLTTHKKLFHTEFPNHSTYIIDEDIIPSLFEIKATSSKDLRMLMSKLAGENYTGASKDFKQLRKLLDGLNNQYWKKVTDGDVIKRMFSADSLERFVKIAAKKSMSLEGSLIGLFSSSYFFVDAKDDQCDPEGEKTIHYLKKNDLPEDKKIIVLSATADREIYESVFDNMEWQEFSKVEQVGNLVQIYDNAFSRAWMNKTENKPMLEEVRTFAGEKKVITFKKHKSRFKHPADFFLESSEGFDTLKGQDIVVVGTPHLQIGVYALLTAALGIPFSSEDLELEMVKCEHRNRWFDFYTFKHEGLRKIQFYKIESQLTQACGRTRTIRENSTVYLFSNFPLAGFEWITMQELRNQINATQSVQPKALSLTYMPSGSMAA